MIYELPPENFHIIDELHSEMDFHLLIPAIVNGKIRGRVWVDDPENPDSALIWDEHYSFSLIGNESNQAFNSALDHLFAETIISDALSREFREGWLECPQRWGEKVQQNKILPKLFPMRHEREYYAIHDSTGLDWANSIPPNLSLKRIDNEFVKRTDLENFNALRDMINLRWNSAENFLRWGFGFCLLQNKTIVSYCLSLANVNKRCDIEIETMEGHQRRGYASLVTAAFVDHALDEGYTEIGWDTFANNTPSVQLGLKLGFKKIKDHTCYSGWYQALDSLLIKAGWLLSQQKNYEEAAGAYEEAFKIIENEGRETQSSYLLSIGTKGRFYFYAAKAYAASGNKKAAIQKLREAIEKGWQELSRTLEDADLRGLHDQNGWEEIVKRLKS